MILTIRTDNPEAEVGLFDDRGNQLVYKKWQAHRALGSTLHLSIKEILDSTGAGWADITKIIFYEGPGSFTGLRIGASVANALAVSNSALVVNATGDDWIQAGLAKNGDESGGATPLYGADAHITLPKK